jgi:hypothetical protein
MSDEAILYYARKFFPHLGDKYGVLCVKAVLAYRASPRPYQSMTNTSPS